jgi:2-dehydropantoate 2-reductase
VDPKEVGTVNLLILTTKTYSTGEATKSSKPMISGETIFLILQNGLGQEKEVLRHVPKRQVLRGITMNGVLPLAPGRILHAGKGETIIGPLESGQDEMLSKVKDVFEHARIQTKISDDIQSDVWMKTLINVGINAVGAIYRKRNGEVFEDEESKTLACAALREAEAVAKALGVKLKEDPLEKTKDVAKKTYRNKNSMWVDLENGRRTEIDAINGFIVAEGRRLNIPTPINEKLTEEIKSISH